MSWRTWPNILALVTFLAGAGLQLSGWKMPWLGYGLMLLAVLVIAVVWSATAEWRLQWPLRKGNRTGAVREGPPSPPDVAESQPLTQEQVAERSAFLRRARAVAEQLSSNTQDSGGPSVTTFFKYVRVDSYVLDFLNGVVRKSEVVFANQVFELLKEQLEDLSGAVSNHCTEMENLGSIASDEDIRLACNQTMNLVWRYKNLLDRTLKTALELRSNGILPLFVPPWPERIRDLGDGYDELARRLKDLRSDTPPAFRYLLPGNDSFRYFDRDFVDPSGGLPYR